MRMFFILVVCSIGQAQMFSVSATRESSKPFFSSLFQNSTFLYNYNPAFVENTSLLLVRCQNPTGSDPYDVGPSALALLDIDPLGSITNSSVVVQTPFGAEDPRLFLHNGVYFLTFTNVSIAPGTKDQLVATLSLGTSTDAKDWTMHGPVFPQFPWSKSAAIAFPNIRTSAVMIWGDSTNFKGLTLAFSDGPNLLKWNEQKSATPFLPVRNSSFFDSQLVEAGPSPVLLSNGLYLFLYNSAQCCFKSPKPGYELKYNIGWAILNISSTVSVVQRCTEPLLSPTLPWEIGTAKGELSLTPNVVFVNGMERLESVDTFRIFYAAADSVIGTAVITVKTNK